MQFNDVYEKLWNGITKIQLFEKLNDLLSSSFDIRIYGNHRIISKIWKKFIIGIYFDLMFSDRLEILTSKEDLNNFKVHFEFCYF